MKKTFNKPKRLVVIIALIAMGLTLAIKNVSFAQEFVPCTTHTDTYDGHYKAGQDMPLSCHSCQDDGEGEEIYDEYGTLIGIQWSVTSVTSTMTGHSCLPDLLGTGCLAKTFMGGYDGTCPSTDYWSLVE
ncbi:MAG: hypothetical protein V4553_16180 [Bacteroidota bacterium]